MGAHCAEVHAGEISVPPGHATGESSAIQYMFGLVRTLLKPTGQGRRPLGIYQKAHLQAEPIQ